MLETKDVIKMTEKPFQNTLYYSDNFKVLRDYIASESVDLIYLDPPFKTNHSYNVLIKDKSDQQSKSS